MALAIVQTRPCARSPSNPTKWRGHVASDISLVIDAYFWPTSDPIGHFRTRDVVYDCAHPPPAATVFLGDNALARSRLGGLLLDGKYGLILINSSIRGGAGGVPEHSLPAWASITPCPGEAWQAVALHEIGHGLGLADEYEDPGRSGETPRDEPNVATAADFSSLGWSDLLSQRPPTEGSVFSIERQAQIRSGHVPPPRSDFVALFQGARYRSDLFRPSWQCLMLSTAITRFCPVCARSIERRIAG